MTATARFETQIDSSLTNWADDIIAEMRELEGADPMEWQETAARLIGALKADGSPRYREVVISTPRQSGKTTLMRAVLAAAAKRKDKQRLYLTAQTRIDALRHLENLGRAVAGEAKVRLSVGSERITWPSMSTLEIIAPTPGGGHGASIDLMVLDEVWDLSPHVMAGIVPATAAKPHAQLIYISTMGTLDSEVWNQLVARGRESIEDSAATIAYLEYSAGNDIEVFDEGKWADWMPALHHTQSVESIRSAKDSLSPGEFIRAFGNRVTAALSVVFPDEWVERAWRIIEPPSRFVLALDVNEEPSGAALATGHLVDDGSAVRVIDWRYGSPMWLPGKVREILSKREVEAIVADFGGPSRVVRAELEALAEEFHVPLIDRVPRDLGADTASFYDHLRESTLHVQKQEPLAVAFAGAVRKDISDLWVVSRRRMSVDASPLIAAIMAHGVAAELSVKPVVWFVLEASE